ncbi:MAG: hypothetical protein K2Q14_04510 [Gammaproteobacteria bacterium]|nr:hypothetical protein [Gammaproteobacteria bacterium]
MINNVLSSSLSPIKAAKFIDIHYHVNPDAYERRYSALQAGRIYKQLNGAVVLKSHLGSTVKIANDAQNEGLPVYGSIVLNKIAGGIDYRYVLRELSTYNPIDNIALLVHLPTITGRTHASKLKRTVVTNIPQDQLFAPETISDESNKLKQSVVDILKLSLDYPIVISSGHANKMEVELLVEACCKLGIKKLVLNQPANPLTGMTFNDLSQLARYDFIWFEQTALTYLLEYQSKEDFFNVILKLPRVIYSSDLGQPSQIDIQQWHEEYTQWLTEKVISFSRLELLVKDNPEKLLMY